MSDFLILTPVILSVLYIVKYIRFSTPDNFPPGPLRLPITGSYLQVLVENYRFPFKRLHNMAKRYNISLLGMYCGPFLTVVACDAKSVRELLLHPDLQGRVDGFTPRLRGLGNLLGIISTDGDNWKEQRRYMLRKLRDFGFGRRLSSFEERLREVKYIIQIIREGAL